MLLSNELIVSQALFVKKKSVPNNPFANLFVKQ
jgi:hypothetical protein